METEVFLVADENIKYIQRFDSLEEARFFCKFTPVQTWFIYERKSYSLNTSGSLGSGVPKKEKVRWSLVEKIEMPGKVIGNINDEVRHGEE